ncbi:PTS sugar transporter subunit IIC [Fructobacillus cardui]|uniref:PTS sugar transporter subunit IIC n=1 Tax=Fructobacillus cardui TaxID=2893170 RepID=UPI0030C8022F
MDIRAFHISIPFAMAGIGFNSFIVPLALFGKGMTVFAAYMAFGVAVPVVVSFILYRIMRKIGWIKSGQTHLEMV